MASGGKPPARPSAAERQVLESPLSGTWRPAVRERAVLVALARGSWKRIWTSSRRSPIRRARTPWPVRAEPFGADPSTYVGKGKLGELHDTVHAVWSGCGDPRPGALARQLRSLEERLGAKVIDRTALILDIFAFTLAPARGGSRSSSLSSTTSSRVCAAGRGDVAVGWWYRHAGPGETKIEVDRQHIRRRMTKFRRDIKDMTRTRDVKGARRRGGNVPRSRSPATRTPGSRRC